MKKTLLLILFVTGFCFGQTYDHIEFYDNGISPKVIRTYKVSKGKIELFKKTEWYYDGQKAEEGTYKDGKEDGLWTYWHENGQKHSEGNYKDGEKHGKWTRWNENGQKRYEGNYKDGKEDGLWSYYTEIGNGKYKVKYTDGTHNMALFTDNLGTDYTGSPIVEGVPLQDDTYLYQKNDYKAYDKKEEYDFSHFPRFFGTFKDGKEDGLWTEWYYDGQKAEEGTYKDGEEDGLWTYWHENGQKAEEETYKDGELISEKRY